jgi:DOPA 4,5-dioxygenase
MPNGQDIAVIEDWHAHVYFDSETAEAARGLRQAIETRFEVEMGRFHERLVGPHPCWSYQVAFKPALFGELVPWLALNRGELVVFVHPNTGDDLGDHRDRPLWLGEKLDLDLSIFK